jgi:hypothetical protein
VYLYSAPGSLFVEDVLLNRIAEKLKISFADQLDRRVSPGELNAWRNSLQSFAHVLSHYQLAKDVLQLSGLLAGDVKESRNGNPTRDLQMAANRTRPHSAAMLADSLAGENPARGTCPVATVVISGDGAGD